jgi:tetratricopeptide (TPR) repeat protein
LAVDRVDELYRVGYAQLQAADWTGAIKTFDAALAILPPDDPNGPGELLNFKGRALASLGQYADALVAHKAALAAGPRCPEFLADLGDTLSALGERQQAIEAYQEAKSKALPGEEILDRIHSGVDNLQ